MSKEKEREEKLLQQAAEESEENRLKVNYIHMYQKEEKEKNLLVVLNIINACMFALQALYFTGQAFFDPEFSKWFVLILDYACSILWSITAHENNIDKKIVQGRINDLKREVLQYNK